MIEYDEFLNYFHSHEVHIDEDSTVQAHGKGVIFIENVFIENFSLGCVGLNKHMKSEQNSPPLALDANHTPFWGCDLSQGALVSSLAPREGTSGLEAPGLGPINRMGQKKGLIRRFQ